MAVHLALAFNPDLFFGEQVEEVVEPGELRASEIHLPGVYVQRLIKAGPHQKRIERLTLDNPDKSASTIDPVREKIVKRAAQELEVRHQHLF